MATTIAPEGQPPENVNARRTESIDAPSILQLARDSTTTLFGRVNVVNIIEKAVLAVTLCNDNDEILGHAAFFDYPNIDNVDQAEWQDWLNKNYDAEKCTPLNSLFMHYFVAKPEYAHGCAREIVRTAFNAVPDVHYLFLAVPFGIFPEAYIASYFKQLPKMENTSSAGSVVFVCRRHQHVPVIHVRQARVEDHDDLTPIFNRQSDMLKLTYGNYFLAELIEAQDDSMQCLVSEVEGTAYGFMSISDDVNYDLLNECFELGPFHGLRKADAEDVLNAAKTPPPPPSPTAQRDDEDRSPSRQSDRSVGDVETDHSKIAESVKDSVKESVKDSVKDGGDDEKKYMSESKQSSGRSSRGWSAGASGISLSQVLLRASPWQCINFKPV